MTLWPYQFCMKLFEIFFTYREYLKILDTRSYSFLTIWFCLWSNIIFIVLMNWVCQHLWKHEIPYLFLTFWPISQHFVTLSANSLPFQGLKKMKSDSWLFQDFPYQWEPWIMHILMLTLWCFSLHGIPISPLYNTFPSGN